MIESELMISCVDNFDKKEDDNKRLTGAITPTTFNLLSTMLVKERRNWNDYTDDSSQSSDELLSDDDKKITKYLNLSNLNILSFEDCKRTYELLLNYLNNFKVVKDDNFFLTMCYTLIGIIPFTARILEFAEHKIRNIYDKSLTFDELKVIFDEKLENKYKDFFYRFYDVVKTRLEHIPVSKEKVSEFIEKISNLNKIDEESIPKSGFELTKLTYRGYFVSDAGFIETCRFILLFLGREIPPHPRHKNGSFNYIINIDKNSDGVKIAVPNPKFPYYKQKELYKKLLLENIENENFGLLVSYFYQLELDGLLIGFIKEAHVLKEESLI